MPDSSDQWLAEFEAKVHSLVGGKADSNQKRVRIAIIDSGLDGTLHEFQLRWTRIKGYKSWVHPQRQAYSPTGLRKSFLLDDCGDEVGHGTHLAALILRLHPWADLYVARVTDSRYPNPLLVAEVSCHESPA